MKTVKTIQLDLAKWESYPRVEAVQGDCYTREVELLLLENGIPWEIPAGSAAFLRFRKPDGTGGLYDTLPDGSNAWKAQGNTVTFVLAPQMLAVPGVVQTQLEIIRGRERVASFTFLVEVAADPSLGTVKSEDYVNWNEWAQEVVAEALAGKAPAGFGLGTTCKGLDVHEITANGWYVTNLNTPTGSYWMCHSFVTNGGADAVVEAWDLGGNTKARKNKRSGVWGQWEWFNPPMSAGVEYPTIERYGGKTVYCKVVALGALGESTMNIPHGIENVDTVVHWSLINAVSGTNITYSTAFKALTVSRSEITIVPNGTGGAQWDMDIMLKYTKKS